MKSSHIILFILFCGISLGINAQSIHSKDNVKVTCKKIDSTHKQFFIHSSTGQLVETGFYHLDQPDLTWIQYSENGDKSMLAQFQNGMKQGIWYIWDEEGFLKYEIHYLNNRIQRAVELDRTGALVASR